MKTRWTMMLSMAAVLLSVAAGAKGQEGVQPVAHLVDAQTLLIAEIDLERVDLPALAGWFIQASGLEGDDAAMVWAGAGQGQQVMADLRQAGATRLYAGFRLTDVAEAAAVWFALPVNEGGDAQRALDLFPAQPHEEEVIDGVVVIAQPKTLERLRAVTPVDRPDLSAGLAAAGDAPIRAAVSLPTDAKRGLIGMLPQLPESLGGGETEALIGGLQWINAAGHLPPQPRMTVTLHSADAETAERLADWLKDVLPKIAAGEPAMNRLVAQLTIRADAQRVYLELNEPQLRRALATYYREDRVRQLRIKSASNLRQIAIAIMLYANENNGMTPPDLGTLLLTVDIDASALVDPRDGVRPPDDLTPQERADWVNRHTSYVYLRPGVKLAEIAPDAPMAYEGQPDEKGEVNVLFGDGHVEIMSKAELDKRLAP